MKNRAHSVSRDSVARTTLRNWGARATLLLSILLCYACRDAGTLMTRSSGKPYEVLILSDDTAAISLVRACLETPVEGMPQVEPSFDVRVDTLSPGGGSQGARSSRFSREYQDARAIVKVLLTPHRGVGGLQGQEDLPVRISYERNVEAQPQIIVTLSTGSVEQLRRERPRWEPSLRQLLTSFEQRATIALLRQKHNQQASDTLLRLFGVKMLVPPDMLSARYEKDFVWLSNNATTGMQNICVFKGTDIDSVVGRYIKGETDAMHMRLSLAVPPRESKAKSQEPRANLTRGLWEMEGDAMGGPYVARFITDTLTHDTITVMGFVYAPETRKRNMVRRLEAIISDVSK